MANKMSLAGPESKFKVEEADPAGFWDGVWHGMISPIALIVSLFKPSVGIYETHNTGRAYDAGFLLGASMALSGGIKIQTGDKDEEEEEVIEAEE